MTATKSLNYGYPTIKDNEGFELFYLAGGEILDQCFRSASRQEVKKILKWVREQQPINKYASQFLYHGTQILEGGMM